MSVEPLRPSGIRVCPPYRTQGMVPSCASLGLVVGIALSLVMVRPSLPILGLLLDSFLIGRPLAALLAAALVGGVLAVRFSRRCQRIWPVYRAGHAYWSSCFAGLWLTSVLLAPGSGAVPLFWYAVIIAAALVIGTVGGFTNLLIRQLSLLFLQVIEQDGTLCWQCGYRVGSPPTGPRCPECGTATTWKKPLPILDRIGSLAKRRWPVVVGTLGVACIIALVGLYRHTISPKQRFAEALADNDNQMSGAMVGTRTTTSHLAWEATGVWRDIRADQTKVLMVLYEPHPDPQQPPMQLRIGSLTAVRLGPSVPTDGTPFVVCDLNDEQSKYALVNGVPESLIDAMVKAANDASWSPLPPGIASLVVVSATEHFPATGADSSPTEED